MPEHKIILVGQEAVGKTAIGIRFLQGTFVNKYDPTIEDSYRKNVQIEGVHYLVEIFDTAGKERMMAIPNLNWKDGQGYIFVYSIASRSSFEYLEQRRKEIEKITESSDFPCLVVGNKSDLEDKREVTADQGAAFASQFEDCEFMEVSAKLSSNIDEIFQKLLQQILKAEEIKKHLKEEEPEEEEPEPAQAPTAAQPGNVVGRKHGKKDKSDKSQRDERCIVQ